MNTSLSPASFVSVYTPHTKTKHAPAILSELLLSGEPTGTYSKQVYALRERFNDMYYTFLERLTSLQSLEQLSLSQQESLNSLFDELLEMRTLLEKDPISTR